jgi:hypothetical protein
LSYTNCESLRAFMNVIIYTILEMLTFFRWHAHLSDWCPYTCDNFGHSLWMSDHTWEKLQCRKINQDCSEAKAYFNSTYQLCPEMWERHSVSSVMESGTTLNCSHFLMHTVVMCKQWNDIIYYTSNMHVNTHTTLEIV